MLEMLSITSQHIPNDGPTSNRVKLLGAGLVPQPHRVLRVPRPATLMGNELAGICNVHCVWSCWEQNADPRLVVATAKSEKKTKLWRNRCFHDDYFRNEESKKMLVPRAVQLSHTQGQQQLVPSHCLER